MNKRICILVILICLFAISLFVGGDSKSVALEKDDPTLLSDNSLDVFFFFGTGCSHCSKVEPFIAEMGMKYPLQIHKFDVYSNRSLLPVFEEYCNDFNLPLENMAVPTVFVSDSYFVGESTILEGFEEVVKNALQEENTSNIQLLEAGEPENPQQNIASAIKSPSIFTITAVALVDAISPCSIAILVFLIGARVLTANRRKRALSVGLAFCLAVFIAYSLFGFGLLTVVQVSGFSGTFSLLVGFLAILAGLFYLKDVFWYGGGGFTMEVPRSLKPLLMKMLKGVTSPFGAFVMGFVAVCFELPCTGGPYLFILGQMANSTTKLQAIPLLLYYNFIFILPLIIISLLLFSNFSLIGKVREWNVSHKSLLRLISAFVMMVLGFLVIPVSLFVEPFLVFLGIFKTYGPAILTIISVCLVGGFLKQKGLWTKLKPYASLFLLLLPLVAMLAFVPRLPMVMAKQSSVSQTTLESNGMDSSSSPLDSLIHDGLNSGKFVFLFFYMDGCGWCKKQKPVIDELEAKYSENVVFIRVNGMEEVEATSEFGVQGFPTMFLIKDKESEGYVYELFSGYTEIDILEQILTNELGITPIPVTISDEQSEIQGCGVLGNEETQSLSEGSVTESNALNEFSAQTQLSKSEPSLDPNPIPLTNGNPSSCVVPSDDMRINSDTTLCPGEYNLADLGDQGVIIINSSDIILNCNNAVLVGSWPGIGIVNDGHYNVHIGNCTIKEFETGIFLVNLENNTLSNNYVLDNGRGIVLDNSNYTVLLGNTVVYNHLVGIFLLESYYNHLDSNQVCATVEIDIAELQSTDNFGMENRCNVTDGWNDYGTTGCTYPCQICPDWDVDGVCDDVDNCEFIDNPDQSDLDNDGIGDACDNCPLAYNPNQENSDLFDDFGDACDTCWHNPYDNDQYDGDGDCYALMLDPNYWDGNKWIKDPHCGYKCDNCPMEFNPYQEDDDGDGVGELCDKCPGIPDNQDDEDGDGYGDECDNCWMRYNPQQENSDNDDYGDACDNCWEATNEYQFDTDHDCDSIAKPYTNDPHCGDACDNCPAQDNPKQEDWDDDGVGDACDCNDNLMGPNELGADCGGICAQTCPSNCIPVLPQGSTTGKIDIVFIPAEDYVNFGGLPAFRKDIVTAIFDYYYSDPILYANRQKFNFWYTPKIATLNPPSMYDMCNWGEPYGWNQGCPQNAFGVIVHTVQCRDYQLKGLYSARMMCPRAFLHELGHLLFKLSDEYDDSVNSPPCKAKYGCPQEATYCNVFASETECKANSENPSGCYQFTTCDGGWWKSQPTHTIMAEECPSGICGICTWGPDAIRQVNDILSKYIDPPPDEMKKAIVGYFHYDGESIEMYDSAIVYGDSPERFLDWEDLRMVFLNSKGDIINEFDLRDPRYMDYFNPVGAGFLDEVDFSLVFPFIDDIRTLEVYDGETGNLLNSIDLSDAIEDFCNEHQNDPQCLSVSVEKTFKPDSIVVNRQGAVHSITSITSQYLSLSEIKFSDTILDGWTVKNYHTVSVTALIDNVKYEIPYRELDYVAVEDGNYVIYINFTDGVDLYAHKQVMTIYAFEPEWILEIKYIMHPQTALSAGDYEATVSVTVWDSEGFSTSFEDTAILYVHPPPRRGWPKH